MRHFSQQGDGGSLFNFLAVVHRCVKHIDDPKNQRGDAESDDQCKCHDDGASRADFEVSDGSFHQAHVGFVDGLLQGDLFSFVEEVGVESLFQGLLALDVQTLLFLFRCAGNFAAQEPLVEACVLELQLNTLNVTLDGGKDALSHLRELSIQLAHHGGLFAGVRNHGVALVHQLVVA